MAAGDIPVEISTPGEVPESRFRDHSDCANICNQMLDADATRAGWRTAVQALHDGNALYSRKQLEDMGQSWRNRTNFRGLEGLTQNISTAVYSLDVEVDKVADIEIDFGKGVEKRDWEESIETHFTWLMLRGWKDSDYHRLMRIEQMVLHGIGYHMFPVDGSWIPKTERMGNVLFPDDCPVNFAEEGEFFMFRDWWNMDQIYRAIQHKDAAESNGWNPEVCWKAMAQMSKSVLQGQNTQYSPEHVQSLYKQGDMQYSSTRRGGMWIDWFFVSEYETGKISLYALAERQEFGGYLFEKRNLYDSFDEVLPIFPYDIGNGKLHSIRGIGARTKEYFEMENRLMNAAADSMMFAATMPMKQNGGEIDKDKLRLLRLGVLSILPDGIEPVQGIQFSNVSQGLVALRNELKTGIAENNQAYVASAPEARDRQTYLEYSMRAQDANKVNKGVHNMYYRNLTRFYDTLIHKLVRQKDGFGKATKLADEFRRRCKQDGVPDEALRKIVDVTAVRSVGAGSAAARLQAMQMLMQTIYPVTTNDRRIAIERDLTATLVGHSMVDRYARNISDNDMPSQDVSFATLENDALSQGGEAQVAERQDHVMHLQVHLGKGEEIYQAYASGQMQPEQAYGALIQIGNHSGQHLQALEGLESRKQEFTALYKRWTALSSDAQRLESHLNSLQNQPPPEQQLSEEGQIKMAKVQIDAQVKDKKVDLDEERKARKQQFSETLEDARTASAINKQAA